MSGLPGLYDYLTVGAVLFGLGLIGFLSRRNLIIMFLCAEMMLQGVTLNMVAFARHVPGGRQRTMASAASVALNPLATIACAKAWSSIRVGRRSAPARSTARPIQY